MIGVETVQGLNAEKLWKQKNNDFVKLFIASSVSKRMENGEPVYLAGKSGIEIVREIVTETKGQ